MLDDYKNEQVIPYMLIRNSVLNKRLSHAYLIDANHYSDSFEFAVSMAKFIFCKNHYSKLQSDRCGYCNICSRIDDGNYPEFRIVEPDGLVIKKEQLLDLQDDFNLSCIEGNYRIYIIKDCEKMNRQSSNCLLKFLEEPVPGVVAILLTNHFSNVLSTIVSRCQVFHLNSNYLKLKGSTLDKLLVMNSVFQKDKKDLLSDDANLSIVEEVLDFVNYFEENNLDILIYLRKKWSNVLSNRDNTILAFFLLVFLYYDALKYKLSIDDGYVFSDYLDEISFVSSGNSVDDLIYKIEVCQYGYNMLPKNVNVNLLVDDIVIRLGDKDGYSRSAV